MTDSWERPRADLLVHFEQQMKAIASSADAYDRGELWEAARLANAVYMLVQDGKRKKTVSILTQVGILAALEFVSSARKYRPGNMLPEVLLVRMRLEIADGKGSACYEPYLENGPEGTHLLPFDTWWNHEPIFGVPNGNPLTRMALVGSLRDQDGGGHLDDKITNAEYIRLSKDERGGWMLLAPDGTKSPLQNAHLAAMRQIAWEVQETLKGVKVE